MAGCKGCGAQDVTRTKTILTDNMGTLLKNRSSSAFVASRKSLTAGRIHRTSTADSGGSTSRRSTPSVIEKMDQFLRGQGRAKR
jgi:hypothetical protein